MSKWIIKNNTACLLFAILGVFHTSSQAKMFTQDDEIERSLTIIAYHNYQDTVPSLIEALQDKKNPLAATSAATLLRRYPQSEQAVAALEKAITDPRESVAVYAAYSLLVIGKKEWVQEAVARLPVMKARIPQIQFSGLLARTGNTKGLKYIIDAILDSDLTLIPIGLEEFAHFEGKFNEKGERIVVVDELSSLAEKASPEAREKILEKINRLRTTSNK